MEIQRYVVVQAVKTTKNELIPIWDERVNLNKSDLYGDFITVNGDGKNYFELVECLYDLKTKTITVGVELNHYPSGDEVSYKKGEVVFFEKSNRKLVETKILDVVYEEYDMIINRGRNLESYWFEIFKDVEFNPEYLYAIKSWKPYYILEDGTKIKFTYQLFKKFNH